jgi:glycerol-3-phosphate dehydrogenase
MEQAEKVLPRQECDVLVIGGGPAGTTIAPLLVEKGYRVASGQYAAL